MDDLEDWLSTKKRYARDPLGVSINNLDVTGYTASAFFQQTFASYISLLPVHLFTLLGVKKQTKVPILRNINGLIQGGEMLLVLGRPGSGCTTFLKTIAGYTHGVEVNEGSIHYQGVPYRHMHKMLPRDTLYQSDEDAHLPELMLGETLSFAAEMRPDGVPSSETSLRIASVFHLQDVIKDRIGNDLIRGLSGGEKRRTSIAESFISNSRIQCLDNSTRGLDSATALRLISILRRSADRLGSTIIMSIYQASEAMYSRFDKVLLLYEGRQIYFGSTSGASEYFNQLGFARPPRATTPDFLTSMSNPSERIALSGYEQRVPHTSDEFANAWLKSEQYKKVQQKLEEFNQMPRASPRVSHSEYYPTSLLHQINKCTLRAFKRLRNNVVPPISGVIGNTVVAIILGSVFFNLEENTASFEPRSILLFYSIMVNACVPAFEVLNMWAQRPIVEKHSRYVFHHPCAEGIASMVADLPNKMITSLCFNTVLYFMANLRRTTAAFLTFWIYAFVAMVTMSMLFRMVGSLSRTYEQSLAPVGTMIFSFIIYAGFVIPPDYQIPWLGWIRWINPIGYAYESLMINEFRNRQFPCSIHAPSGAEYITYGNDGKTCVAIGATPGQDLVEGNRFLSAKYGYQYDRVWNNVGFLFLLMVIFCAIHLVAAQKILAQRSRGDILLFRRKNATQKPSDEEEGEKEVVAFEVDTEEISTTLEGECDSSNMFEKESSIFHWQNVSYEIKGKRNVPRVLLDGVTGWVRPGTLTALMGATGAGKTTLLDILADRKSVGIVHGHIHVDNQKCDSRFQGRTGYVQQADLHLPTATVREALKFSALLRQTSGTAAQKLAYVDTVLSMLDMNSYADAIIGVPGKGLNVEQRKRLTIAVEMAAKPEFLLFLDEPTSGLDSQTSWSICKLLRKLANEGLAIMCTIHQPSTQLFETFDRMLLLGKGKTIYFGDIGHNSTTIFEYFRSHGARPCEEGENPAEWLLEVTSSSANPSYWPDMWKASKELAAIDDRISALKTINTSSGTSPQSMCPSHQEYAATLSQQVVTVTYRAFQDYWRDPTYLYSKLALCVGPALFNGLSLLNTSNDIQSVTNIFFSCFLLAIIFTTIDQQIIPRFIEARSLFEAREAQSKTYSWPVFIIANMLVEIFWQTIASVLVFMVWYYPTGLWENSDPTFPGEERAGIMLIFIWLFLLFTSTLSQALAIAMDDAQTVINVAQALWSLAVIFCGILVAPGDLPVFWKFMYRLSPATYLVNGMVIAGIANTNITCSSTELLKISLPEGLLGNCSTYMRPFLKMAGGYVVDEAAVDGCTYCPLRNANEYLTIRELDVKDRWNYVGLFSVYVLFNIIATFGLYKLARTSKSAKK